MTTRLHDDPEDPALGLAVAVIASSTAPLVLLDGKLDVTAASLSFCEHFRIDPTSVRDGMFPSFARCSKRRPRGTRRLPPMRWI